VKTSIFSLPNIAWLIARSMLVVATIALVGDRGTLD